MIKNKINKIGQIRLALLTLVLGGILIFSSVWLIKAWYGVSLKPLSSSTAVTTFTVTEGDSVRQIGIGLQKAKLIRSSKAFETYVRANPFADNLQAGTYALSPSMSVREIVNKMAKGEIIRQNIVILPAKRLDEIKKEFIRTGYSEQVVADAFNPANYRGHPALASLPAGASLEGYLYPESFQKNDGTPAPYIVRQSLDQMAARLTPELIAAFNAQGLNVHQAIILSSIVLKETDDPQYAPTVAQVLLLRLKRNMKLESDPTAFYAADIASKPRSLAIDSLYNTYKHIGLPPGPISNITSGAMNAVANPSKTDYLYFVAGDDKKVYFSKTLAEHERAIAAHCKKGCGH